MEQITANLSGRTRRATLHGREYIVAPMTLIVPGVLNGSKGPLYYPLDEIVKDPTVWNGMPLVVYHPEVGGRHVSARNPETANKSQVGRIYNAQVNGKLTAEGWFSVEAIQRVDDRVLQALKNDQPIELSTGLFTDNEPAKNGAEHKGKPYSFVARNYKPDHVAVLPDQIGACSIEDGCGVLVNEEEQTLLQGLLAKIGINYSPSQPRGAGGRWGSGGGGGGGAKTIKQEYEATRAKRTEVQERLWTATEQGKDVVKLREELHGLQKQERGLRDQAVKGGKIEPPKGKSGVGLKPSQKVEGTSHTVKDLDQASQSAGKELFGKNLAHDGVSEVIQGKLSDLKGAQRKVGDFEFVFFPSKKGKGADVSGRTISKKMADKDGKIYLYDADNSQVSVVNFVQNYRRSTMTDNEREKIIDNLITNEAICCWDEDDRATLNELSNEKLTAMGEQAEKDKEREAVTNAAKKGFTDPGGSTHTYNEKKKEWESKLKKEDLEPVTNADKSLADSIDPKQLEEGDSFERVVVNKNGVDQYQYRIKKGGAKPQTSEEWMNAAPAEVRSAVHNAMEIEARERAALIERLTKEVTDNETRQKLQERLGGKPLDELRDLMALAPAGSLTTPTVSYVGAAAPVGNQVPTDNVDKNDILPLPSTTFTKEEQEKKQA